MIKLLIKYDLLIFRQLTERAGDTQAVVMTSANACQAPKRRFSPQHLLPCRVS